eukprot:CAMPEP_0178694744 /NCGR_PEP_ID=MMETSP0699-20121125/8428_1 /TAXON_ID=265572 /ORGANISM="Extubocellulus spinifer, Strain CCMP396" /LENGTH=1093 /DNA_ID=CAMNT_0020340281 /DNA_START=64 /DNA_END=3345 /DNA_ORIENTATION=+
MSGTWTDAQDRALEGALAEYPATMDKNERWTAIAAAVPGRSKKECVARFKEIRQALLKQKQQQQSAVSDVNGNTGKSEGGKDTAKNDRDDEGGAARASDDTNRKSGADGVEASTTDEVQVAAATGGLLIPGQAVNKANHRRASGGNGADTEERTTSSTAASVNFDAGAVEFVPGKMPARVADTSSAAKLQADVPAEAKKKKKGSQGRRRGNKAADEQQSRDTEAVGDKHQQKQQSKQNNRKQQNAKSEKKKNGGKTVELQPTADPQQEGAGGDGGEAKKAKSRNRKKQNKKKKNDRRGRFAWRNEIPSGAVDPISLDPLVELPYPPFALVATVPYDVIDKWPVPEEEERRMELMRGATKAGEEGEEEKRRIAERELEVIREQWGDAVAASASAFSGQNIAEDEDDAKAADILDSDTSKVPSGTGRRYYHLFDGRVLAYYLVSQLQFIDPLNRRDLTRAELLNLDTYLERHSLGRAGVTEAYDARGVTVSTAGVAGQTAEGRAEILQQEARTLLGSLFSGDSHADGAASARRHLQSRARAAPRFDNEFQRHYVESERRQQGARQGSRAAGRRPLDEATDQSQDAGVYGADEGGILVIDDDENPGLRGGVSAASESARQYEETTGRGAGEPSTGTGTLYSASHIADRYGHASRVQTDNFPSLPASSGDDAPSSMASAQDPKMAPVASKPSKSLLKMAKMVKKTTPAEAARQKKATEEARRRAALANLSFQVPGSQPVLVGNGDGTDAAATAEGAATHEATEGQLQRNRAFASALGVQPATMRSNFNSGWARPVVANIELDEFGNELNAAQYPDALIIEAKERMTELLKLEKKWKAFLADDTASSQPLRAMPRDLRKFVHEYSDFWNLHTESFDPEPRRYIHCTKMRDTSLPHPLLSEATRKWRGPGTGAPLLPIRPKREAADQQQMGVGRGATTREFTVTEERKPLKLEPRSVPAGFVAASMSMPPGAMFDVSESAQKQEEGDDWDNQPAERFSSLLAERERTKLTLAPRTKPLELPAYQGKDTKSYDIAKARERMERETKVKLEKQRKKEEKKKNILASAFASSSDENSDNNSAASSDWGDEQAAVFDGSDSEW